MPGILRMIKIILKIRTMVFFVSTTNSLCINLSDISTEFLSGYPTISFELKRHARYLADDKNYLKNQNHGLFQDKALLFLGYFFKNQEWIELSKKRLLGQWNFLFTDEMVCVERIPEFPTKIVSSLRIYSASLIRFFPHFPLAGRECKHSFFIQTFTTWIITSYGQDIFVDSGFYSYMFRNPIRRYLRSANAHNTVIVDGVSFPFLRSDLIGLIP